MHLIRLIYASSVSTPLEESDLEQILSCARENNARLQLSGILYFSQNFFLQCLEGDRASVNTIYRNILSDPRHHDVQILDYSEIHQREFSDWHMGYVPRMNVTKKMALRYSGQDEFQPYLMSGESAYLLLKHLRDELPFS